MDKGHDQCSHVCSIAEEQERHERIFGQLSLAPEKDDYRNAAKNEETNDLGRAPWE